MRIESRFAGLHSDDRDSSFKKEMPKSKKGMEEKRLGSMTMLTTSIALKSIQSLLMNGKKLMKKQRQRKNLKDRKNETLKN